MTWINNKFDKEKIAIFLKKIFEFFAKRYLYTLIFVAITILISGGLNTIFTIYLLLGLIPIILIILAVNWFFKNYKRIRINKIENQNKEDPPAYEINLIKDYEK